MKEIIRNLILKASEEFKNNNWIINAIYEFSLF
jgi:hypothetical protein